MMRLFMAWFAVVSVLIVATHVVEGQTPVPKDGVVPKSNQVYVKIILPYPPTRDKNRPVVESWIAEQLKKRGQSKFFAATEWVPLADNKGEFKDVWDGDVAIGICPVMGTISERANGRVKVSSAGNIGWGKTTVSLMDEPGSRKIAVSDYVDLGTEQRIVDGYMAVLIGPPSDLSVPKKPD